LARLITKTLPRRRTTTDPGLLFSDLTELRTFMAASSRRAPSSLLTHVTTTTHLVFHLPDHD
jgi:hypothetical protein